MGDVPLDGDSDFDLEGDSSAEEADWLAETSGGAQQHLSATSLSLRSPLPPGARASPAGLDPVREESTDGTPTSAATHKQVRGPSEMPYQHAEVCFYRVLAFGVLGRQPVAARASAPGRAREPGRPGPRAGGVHGWHAHLRGHPPASERTLGDAISAC